ncbi:MAG: hypothetical protein L0387_28885, partial [Acidobacteria bacterium]|nr:hypothetical protein [Acidobacteriota bacterium]
PGGSIICCIEDFQIFTDCAVKVLKYTAVTTFRERNGKVEKIEMQSWKAGAATILYPEAL